MMDIWRDGETDGSCWRLKMRSSVFPTSETLFRCAAQEPEVGFLLASTFFLRTFSTSAGPSSPDLGSQVGEGDF